MSVTTVANADDYFTDERLNADAWHDAASAQQAALNMAENFLGAAATLDFDNPQHVIAVYEQALFELQNQGGSDKRASLHAMGVTAAGIVKEVYEKTGVFMCAYAAQVLQDALLTPSATVTATRMTRNDCDCGCL